LLINPGKLSINKIIYFLRRCESMKIKPLGNRVVLKVLEAKEKTKGGIILPDTAKEKPQEAEVVAVGTGKKTEDGKVLPLSVKVGDKVLCNDSYSSSKKEITLDGQEYLIIKEDDILGIVE